MWGRCSRHTVGASLLRRACVAAVLSRVTWPRGSLPSKMVAISAEIPPAGPPVLFIFFSPHHPSHHWMAVIKVRPWRPMPPVSAPGILARQDIQDDFVFRGRGQNVRLGCTLSRGLCGVGAVATAPGSG